MTNNSEPQTKQVTLSDGTQVTVSTLTWKGWKSLKALIAKTVSGPVLREAVAVITGPIGGIVADLLSGITAAIKTGDGAAEAQANLAASLVDKWNATETTALILGGLDQLKLSLANILDELLSTSDEFTEILIACSCGQLSAGKLTVGDVTVDDVIALRDAALDINDLGKLFNFEKNWLGRVVLSGKACLGTPNSNTPGTSTQNTV